MSESPLGEGADKLGRGVELQLNKQGTIDPT